MKVQVGERNFYIDGFLKNNLDIAIKEIKNDWDMIFLYDGAEGAGKSVKAMQDAYYVDPTFNIDRVAFTPNQFRKAIFTAEKYNAIQYDEAYSGLSSRATMSLINRTLVSMLTEIRERNLFIMVVLPCFFDVDKYVALWRSRILIHIYTHEGFKRGFFSFYNAEKKKQLYLLGKKFYSYSKPDSNFIGRFTNYYTIDEKEYRRRKHLANAKREDDRIKAEVVKEQQKLLFERLVDNNEVPDRLKAKIIDISEPTYYRWLRQYKDMKEVYS